MLKRLWIVLAVLLVLGIVGYSQQKIDIAKITAPASGPQPSANSDSVTQCTSCTWNTAAVPTISTTGGCSNKVIEPTASDNHQVIKNGAGTACYVIVFNNSATVNYGRLYNAGTGFNGCNSATNLLFEFQIPASTSVGGFAVPLGPTGLAFTTGLSACFTGAFGQTDTTNATASAISANVGYN